MKPIEFKDFIKKAKQKHGLKYDYSSARYVNGSVKIHINCKICGYSFTQLPRKHLFGQGCPRCAGKNKDTNCFIEQAKTIHGNKYGYSKVRYSTCFKKVSIYCNKCDKYFSQTPAHHLNNRGCPFCKFKKAGATQRLTKREFLKKAHSVHGDAYDYSSVRYKNNHSKFPIVCNKCNKKFFRTLGEFIYRKRGCPSCAKSLSFLEQEFLKYCHIRNNPKNRQLRIGMYRVDGYKITTNTVYEFLGDFWHGNPERYDSKDIHPIIKKTHGQVHKETFIRLNKIKNMGYNVVYIWEKDWKDYKNGITDTPNIQKI